MYIDAGCNVYFDFSLRMNERKITSHSGHAILAAQIAVSLCSCHYMTGAPEQELKTFLTF